MIRKLALGLLWGLVAWNGVALAAFVTGLPFAPLAAPLGFVAGIVIVVIAGAPRFDAARTPDHLEHGRV